MCHPLHQDEINGLTLAVTEVTYNCWFPERSKPQVLWVILRILKCNRKRGSLSSTSALLPTQISPLDHSKERMNTAAKISWCAAQDCHLKRKWFQSGETETVIVNMSCSKLHKKKTENICPPPEPREQACRLIASFQLLPLPFYFV